MSYFAMIRKWPRRFCDQQPSVDSVQNGDSSPRLVVWMRPSATPRLTR